MDVLKFNSYDEIRNLNHILWETPGKNDGGSIRIDRYGVFYLPDFHFPKYFKGDSSDPYCCTAYWEISKEEYNEEVTKEIARLEKRINDLKKQIVD